MFKQTGTGDIMKMARDHQKANPGAFSGGPVSSGGVGRPRDPSEIRALKKDIHRKIGIANKRIDRLKEQGLENAPAYRNLVETSGTRRFSIKGYKSKNELRRLEAQLDQFINRKTSTVTGVKKWRKGIADSLGVNYEKVSEIGHNLDKYIDLLGKLTQLQRSRSGVEQGSDRRVNAINKYIQENEINIGAVDIDDLVQLVDDMMQEEEEAYIRQIGEWEEFDGLWTDDEWYDEEGR